MSESNDESNNNTFVKRAATKRGLLWFELNNKSNESLSTNDNSIETEIRAQSSHKDKDKDNSNSSRFEWIQFNDKEMNDSENENKPEVIESEKKRLKRTEMGFNFVPLGQNLSNISPKENHFVVPQCLPSKLKKKMTPLKSTPRRRSSGSSSSSLRRATFRVTPRPGPNFNLISATTTKKKRSSGHKFTPFLTPKAKPSTNVVSKPLISSEDIQYISWINGMLATKTEEKVDKSFFNQLIIDCFNSNKTSLTICPTKEKKSVDAYKELMKWNQLRASANALYRSDDNLRFNRKINEEIQNEKFTVRKDRALHADISIRKHIMELLLSYNTLWLRIGLETVFQQKITITTHSLRYSLGQFIAQNLLVSKELIAKYGHKTVSNFFKDEHHIKEANKYILLKYMLLVNFLDRAKQERIIEHNPCLFRKDSQIKSTLDLIKSFGRDYITGVGDITKHLRFCGFSMNYRQTPIEEFDFECNNLAVDLRNGIRLTRITEVITEHKDLLPSLLFPADNITRKLHNVEVALNALGEIVPKGIVAKDIVSGHRKKTFQLLDAIIFKYREHQILMEKKRFEQNVVFIQRFFRNRRQMKEERHHFERLKHFTVILQKRFRENKWLRIERKQRIIVEKSVLLIQRKFRANRLMKTQQNYFQRLKKSVLFIQSKFRGNRLMKSQRMEFQKLRHFTVCIQRHFRGNRLMVREQQRFQAIKSAAILIQTKFKANKYMKIEKQNYQKLKYYTIIIQRKFRAKREMEKVKHQFQTLKSAAILIQRIYRAQKLMKAQKQEFLKLKSSAIVIQTKFRALQEMKKQKFIYQRMKSAALLIQTKFRANKDMKKFRHEFQSLKSATILIQQKYRANKQMQTKRIIFIELKRASILIQRLNDFRKCLLIDLMGIQN